MAHMVQLTDLMDDSNMPFGVVPVDKVAATLREAYPADDKHVRPSELEKINEFQAALLAEDDEVARELAAELSISFDEVQG